MEAAPSISPAPIDPEPAATARSRPGGVTAVAVYEAIIAVLSILTVLAAFNGMGPIFGTTTLLLGIGAGVVAYGNWTRKRWAFTGTFVFHGLQIAVAVLAWAMTASWTSLVTGLIAGGIVLGYYAGSKDPRAWLTA